MNKPTANQAKPIQFNCNSPGAKRVAVAGTFNNWDPGQAPLRKGKNGDWSAKIPLPPGRHEYRLVVDGEWRDDPAALESVPNTHGTRNAVIVVP